MRHKLWAILFFIFAVSSKVTAPCPGEKMGPYCRTYCHCQNGCGNKTSTACGNECAIPWSGPTCQRKNVAYKQSTERSSVYNNDDRKFWGVRAVDGDLSTRFASNTEWDPYLGIDTGRINIIHSMRIYNGLKSLENISGFEMEVSNSSSFRKIDMCYTDNQMDALEVYNINCTTPLYGRYVRFIVRRYTALSIRGLRIYRCEDFWFGDQCDFSCNCYNSNELCNKVTGHCLTGCAQGFTGESCYTDKPDIEETPVAYLVAVLLLVILSVSLAIVSVVFILKWKNLYQLALQAERARYDTLQPQSQQSVPEYEDIEIKQMS